MEMSVAEVFTREVVVTEEEIDALGHANNISYLKWVQDIAEAHWLARAHEEYHETCIWVVLNHYIEYKRPAFLRDHLTVKTYVGATSGPRSMRHVEILREGTLLAWAKTEWCLLDLKTKRPKRITGELKNFFKNPGDEKGH